MMFKFFKLEMRGRISLRPQQLHRATKQKHCKGATILNL